MSKNISELSGRKGLENNLFDKYGQLAMDSGAPSVEELESLASEFLLGTAQTYGATTFYDFLKPENKGKQVYVCSGSVCLCAGTQAQLKDTLQNHFSPDEIGEMCCLGRCHENSAFHYKGRNYSGDAIQSIDSIVESNYDVADKYQVSSIGTPVLTSPHLSADDVQQLWHGALTQSPKRILEASLESSVRGRGGAGFPMGKKMEFCKSAPGDTKFVICNADEGDPGAFSDRYLLEERPNAVLLGMMLAGYAIGANWGVVYIRGEYPESVNVIESVIKQFTERNLLGLNINESGFDFHFKVIKAQGSYICGEETALINSIEGQRPEVRVRPPYPAQRGLFNKPTIVNNVETLACLPYIVQNGGGAYNQLGTDRSSGTKLVSLDGYFNKPGIVEVEMGTPLSDVVYGAGGGFREPVKALHIGGPLGGLVPEHKIHDLTIDFESFKDHGFLLGHASVVCIPKSYPIVRYLEHLFEFAAHESCGKCFPCRLGTKRAQEMLHKAQHDGYKIDRSLFDDLLHTLEIGSLCAHGGGIPLPVRNALEYFEDEMRIYFSDAN
jgi:NADH-quinone oxidoreductase subunit F